jgi:hypothetical protein
MTRFGDAFERAAADANNKGSFQLLPGESINNVVARENVPNGRGVYLIFDPRHSKQPIYIGKAGTMQADGCWEMQGIRGRLTAVQKKMRRVDFFRELMRARCCDGLVFHWFVTHDGEKGRLPALVEMELLQAYLDEFGRLPILNESA